MTKPYNNHIFQQLLNAASTNDLSTVAMLLTKYGSPNCIEPLWLAAEYGYADCLKLLISGFAHCDTDNYALQRAAMHGHSECVAILLPFSSPTNTRTALIKAVENSSYGVQPLCEKRAKEYRTCITMLLDECDGQQVLYDFQIEYPGDTHKWGILEECLQTVQREKILSTVEHKDQSFSRKM